MSNIGTKFNLDNRFIFDPNNNALIDKKNGDELTYLGSNESRILQLLCEKRNEIISRSDLHDFVWRKQGFEVDDSSLTQAISTLRRELKDSTKSPAYVKTVPKRGYQLICSVKRVNHLLSGENQAQDSELESAQTAASNSPQGMDNIEVDLPKYGHVAMMDNPFKIATATSDQPSFASQSSIASQFSLTSKLMIFFAILLPLCTAWIIKPEAAKFEQLGVFDGIVVKTPVNQPSLEKWYPFIEHCVKAYNQNHTDELAPIVVIATGGEEDQISLSSIHALEYSDENTTVQIFTDQQDLTQTCQ